MGRSCVVFAKNLDQLCDGQLMQVSHKRRGVVLEALLDALKLTTCGMPAADAACGAAPRHDGSAWGGYDVRVVRNGRKTYRAETAPNNTHTAPDDVCATLYA